MNKFEIKQFNLPDGKAGIPKLKGISEKNIEEHLKLYAGYVKNANLIQSMIEMYSKVDDEGGKYSVSEITRRFSFEFNGMRNHEYFFSSLEGGAKPLPENSQLKKVIEKQWTTFDAWLSMFKSLAMTRGVGWAVLYWDKETKQFVSAWIDEHHLGQLNGLHWILGIDMWEHAFVADYQPSGKKNYVDDFFENLNWEVIEQNFSSAF